MGFFKKIKTLQKTIKEIEKITQEKPSINKKDNVEHYRLVGGKSKRMTEGEVEVHEAWVSGDLDRMLGALNIDISWVDRHSLLSGIVKATYKLRHDKPEMKMLCKQICEMHLKEFPAMVPSLKKDNEGYLPQQVPTFKHYATILTEDGEYGRAIEVCGMAISYDLCDGTKAGYAGRLDRIRKTAERVNIEYKDNSN